MLYLTIRTDKPEAEIGLFDGQSKLAYSTWTAHRQLAETINLRIKELMDSQGQSLDKLQGIAVYKGPGSFTGLRIGLSVANALAYSLKIPIVAMAGDNWLEQADRALRAGQSDKIVLPEYGSPPHVTRPKY